jgi:hypothetical protein
MQYLLLCCFDETRWAQLPDAQQGQIMQEYSMIFKTRSEDCELIVVDEATVRRHPTLTAQWCWVEDVLEVPTGEDHTKVHVYGVVAPLTGRTHYHGSPELGQEEFAQFLPHLLVYYPGKRLLVIHDRGAQPKGASIEEVGRKVGEPIGPPLGPSVLKAHVVPLHVPEVAQSVPERLGEGIIGGDGTQDAD